MSDRVQNCQRCVGLDGRVALLERERDAQDKVIAELRDKLAERRLHVVQPAKCEHEDQEAAFEAKLDKAVKEAHDKGVLEGQASASTRGERQAFNRGFESGADHERKKMAKENAKMYDRGRATGFRESEEQKLAKIPMTLEDLPRKLRHEILRRERKAYKNGQEAAQQPAQPTSPTPPEIAAAARELGSKGGLKGGPARAEALSPRRRKEIARRAAQVRWTETTNLPPRG